MSNNCDKKVIEDFGREWELFDQSGSSTEELKIIFDKYFSIFPWKKISKDSEGLDLGCGSGRWASFVAPHVRKLHCVEPPTSAFNVAQKKLFKLNNCVFHNVILDEISLKNNSMDFAYSLGVLHHVPDTALAIKSLAKLLKPGAPLLLYLYYKFDNKPLWFKSLWKISDFVRRAISLLPHILKFFLSQIIALIVYWPLAKIACFANFIGLDTKNYPLNSYRNKSFYIMRTDALDRFGTRLEKRFTKKEIELMLLSAGLEKVKFRNEEPFWCVLSYRKEIIDEK